MLCPVLSIDNRAETTPGSLAAPPSADFYLPTEPKLEVLPGGWPVKGVNFSRQQATLVLDVSYPNLAETIVDNSELVELTEHDFRLTPKPHITVVNFANGNNILKKIEQFSPAGQGIILRDIERIAGKQDWSWTPTGELYPFVGRNHYALKLIAMVDCPGASRFYEQLEEYLGGVEIERHDMHITLLKRSSDGNGSQSDLTNLQLGRPINGLGDRHDRNIQDKLRKMFRISGNGHHQPAEKGLGVFRDIGDATVSTPSETAEKVTEDFRNIDVLAAAALGRRLTLVPEAVENFRLGARKPMPSKLSPGDKAAFFDRQIEKALEVLQSPQIVPQMVITGAIIQIARFFNNQRLLEEAERRVDEEPTYYPVMMRADHELLKLSDRLLKNIN